MVRKPPAPSPELDQSLVRIRRLVEHGDTLKSVLLAEIRRANTLGGSNRLIAASSGIPRETIRRMILSGKVARQ